MSADPFAYYPFTIRSGQRPDQIAEAYYKDPNLAWLVYHSANVVDPYYGWPLDNQSFSEYIVDKYGSFPNAQKKIVFWQVNWPAQSDITIDPSGYNALPDPIKKYYDPIFGSSQTDILRYVRRREDWTVNTNTLQGFSVANGLLFQLGEGVSLRFSANNIESGNGVVSFANAGEVICQHVFGNLAPNTTTYLYGTNSGANQVTTQSTNLANNIPAGELAFWAPVYALDYETDLNEAKKAIRLLDSRYQTQVDREIDQDLQGSGPV